MNNSQVIYEIIKNKCKDKNISFNQVIENCGLSQNFFVSWKKKWTIPRTENLQKIAQYLDIPINYLLGTESSSSTGESLSAQKQKILERIARLNEDQAREVQEYVDYILSKGNKK